MKVYLAGAITGLSYGSATDWRVDAQQRLAKHGIVGVSPLRAKDYLLQETSLRDSYADVSVLSSQKGITTRDRWDATTCDVLLANLTGCERVSIGTCMDLGWADAARRPIVLAMEDGCLHDHAMIREVAGFIVPTVDEALELVIALNR